VQKATRCSLCVYFEAVSELLQQFNSQHPGGLDGGGLKMALVMQLGLPSGLLGGLGSHSRAMARHGAVEAPGAFNEPTGLAGPEP
jgi:hypothetical protein